MEISSIARERIVNKIVLEEIVGYLLHLSFKWVKALGDSRISLFFREMKSGWLISKRKLNLPESKARTRGRRSAHSSLSSLTINLLSQLTKTLIMTVEILLIGQTVRATLVLWLTLIRKIPGSWAHTLKSLRKSSFLGLSLLIPSNPNKWTLKCLNPEVTVAVQAN